MEIKASLSQSLVEVEAELGKNIYLQIALSIYKVCIHNISYTELSFKDFYKPQSQPDDIFLIFLTLDFSWI